MQSPVRRTCRAKTDQVFREFVGPGSSGADQTPERRAGAANSLEGLADQYRAERPAEHDCSRGNLRDVVDAPAFEDQPPEIPPSASASPPTVPQSILPPGAAVSA